MPSFDIPGFASGGIVPGPIGQPQLAVVHGGENIQTPEQQQSGNGGGIQIGNITINANSRAEGEAAANGFNDRLRAMGLA